MAAQRATDARARSVDELITLLDSAFLRALTEPARLELLKVLLRHGPADVGAIAARLPQDRSVISRHLKVLHDVGVVRARSEGRHRIYEVDGQSFLSSFEGLLSRVRELAPVCCPP
ncbi:helix-turn-helix transcriptional regulator [Myxococcus sp. RHSTA-1-4]|uniref:ArsR/SmtB family transcription factor n=1 Tax=Myxococcus sp. RHSTA-1-4 TaxID=2874601 RepID=UPI001CC03955|nr:metalloregulator ArsR/SmtB family transcription factor [Myxococcus sp. RHSTA-1-4]MBZ4417091.1 metalloregulator ArsR/SmtB family transcription factor [Myxococcus sp. RHSTA-1-4]